jgi:hypothetical protein
VDNDGDTTMRDASLTEWVASMLATLSVVSIVWLAVNDDAAAKTALTGLVGAASSYFLTPKLAARRTNGPNGTTPPAV